MEKWDLQTELKKIEDEHNSDIKFLSFVAYGIFTLAMVYAVGMIYVFTQVMGGR